MAATPESGGGSLLGSPLSSAGQSHLTPPHEMSYPLTPPPPPHFNIPGTAVSKSNNLIETEDEWDTIASEVQAYGTSQAQTVTSNDDFKAPVSPFEAYYRGNNNTAQLSNQNSNFMPRSQEVDGPSLPSFQPATASIQRNISQESGPGIQSNHLNFPAELVIMPDSENASWSSTPSRYIRVSQLPVEACPEKLYSIFQGFGNIWGINMGKLSSEGLIYVAYYDLRDAMKAQRGSRETWLVQFCKATKLVTLSGDLVGHTIDNEGEIISKLNPNDNRTFNDPNQVGTAVYCLRRSLEIYGEIYELRSLNSTNIGFTFIIQYYDIRDAWTALVGLNNSYVNRFHVLAQEYKADVTLWSKASLLATIPTDILPRAKRNRHDLTSPLVANFNNLNISALGPLPPRYGPSEVYFPNGGILEKQIANDYVCNGAMMDNVNTKNKRIGSAPDLVGYMSPSRHNNMAAQSSTRPSSRASSRGMMGGYKHDQYPTSGKNVVDLNKINTAADMRTTIMIRNIPNKVDQQMLKDYIDETSIGEYDFLYLRIDFKNQCNVGYAFLNFVDPLSIVKFTQARAGTKWNKFNSEKVAEVSYANIQGKEALVEKFRNSSVMDQDPSYRPKIFHSSGPLKGEEMPFPAANNMPRKLRSITAAQHVGLYNPKSSEKFVFRGVDDENTH